MLRGGRAVMPCEPFRCAGAPGVLLLAHRQRLAGRGWKHEVQAGFTARSGVSPPAGHQVSPRMGHGPWTAEGFAFVPRGNARPAIPIWTRSCGSGPTALMLHGWMHSGAVWSQVAGGLSDRYTVVAPDWPGFGKTPALPDGERPSVDAFVEVLAGLLTTEAVPAPPAIIVADSLAAIVVLRAGVGVRLPVSVLALSGCPYFGVSWLAVAVARSGLLSQTLGLVRRLPISMSTAFFRLLAFKTVRHWRHSAGVIPEAARSADPKTAQYLLAELGTVEPVGSGFRHNAPRCLVVRGEYDRLATAGAAAALARDLGADTYTIAGAAHTPMLESAAEFISVLRRLELGDQR